MLERSGAAGAELAAGQADSRGSRKQVSAGVA